MSVNPKCKTKDLLACTSLYTPDELLKIPALGTLTARIAFMNRLGHNELQV